MKEFKYISTISKNEIEASLVIPCIDESGKHAILIKNSVNKRVSTKYSTDNMNVQMDSVLYFDGKEYFFHILTATKNDDYSIKQFNVIYEYIFKKIESPINGNELGLLISSIEEYFRISPEADLFKTQVGVFGEFLAIKYLHDNGYPEIADKYHTNFYSKHDIEISSDLRIEIKTTLSEKRIHRFSHNQISRNDIKVYVISLLLEEAKEGVSLFELFEEIFNYYHAPDSLLALRKLIKKCGVDEDHHGPKFALNKALDDIRIYNADDLPKISNTIPDEITNIKYDVDCSKTNNIKVDDFIKLLKTN